MRVLSLIQHLQASSFDRGPEALQETPRSLGQIGTAKAHSLHALCTYCGLSLLSVRQLTHKTLGVEK